MPGPGPIWNLLVKDAPPMLHSAEFDAAFVDTLDAIWEWPGAREFGVVVLLRPFELRPVVATEIGGYIIDVAGLDPDATVYAPDPEVARAVAPANCWDDARSLLPADYKDRLQEAVGRVERYMDLADSLRPLMATLDDGSVPLPEGVSYAAGVPLFKQTPEVQRRLAELGKTNE
ncbi:MAG: hypothetical protein ACJAYU_003065 [Bradymonadia bacterium]|jgi:hypothetical protein